MQDTSALTLSSVLKFGGSSVSSVESLASVLSIVQKNLSDSETVVLVVSALAGSTSQLRELSQLASQGGNAFTPLFSEFKEKHTNLVRQAIGEENCERTLAQVLGLLEDLQLILYGISLVKDISPRTADLVLSFGERISAVIVCDFLNLHLSGFSVLDSRDLVVTDSSFGCANVLTQISNENIRKYFVGNPGRHVVTGYIGATSTGETTTLGPGGSDYTATVFGAALGVDEIQIWTHVDGVMTADPRKVEKAFTIPFLSYEEAMEFCHFGARVFYPRCIQPAFDVNIPIRIRNTFAPEREGTLISARLPASKFAVTGVASIPEVALMRLEGSGMVGVAGVAKRLFDALSRAQINVILISQASSEHSICFAIDPRFSEAAKNAIAVEYALEIQAHQISPLRHEGQLAIVAIVGANMRNSPGIAARVFQALGKNGINVSAIAQGSSELNISVVIDAADEKKALAALHDTFFLSDLKTIHLYLVGTGQVGSTLLSQLQRQQEHFRKLKLEFKLVGLANTRKMIVASAGLGNNPAETLESKGERTEIGSFVQKMLSANLPNSVFVDCTASDSITEQYAEILRSSISVVTPNKRANSGQYATYQSLKAHAERANVKFFYETNVGAGLPVIGTLNDLMYSGDEIIRIEAVLSGTISFIFNRFSADHAFSDVVKEAKEKGYTEPDPRDDLSGTDVARKLLILGREAGLPFEIEDITVESLVPELCRGAESIEQFFEMLTTFDAAFEEKRSDAAKQGCVLRHIGRISDGKATVTLEAVNAQHPFYNLSGSDNIISFTTKRYSDRPLVVKGPGAGTDVTAAGVLADIVRVAGYLA